MLTWSHLRKMKRLFLPLKVKLEVRKTMNGMSFFHLQFQLQKNLGRKYFQESPKSSGWYYQKNEQEGAGNDER